MMGIKKIYTGFKDEYIQHYGDYKLFAVKDDCGDNFCLVRIYETNKNLHCISFIYEFDTGKMWNRYEYNGCESKDARYIGRDRSGCRLCIFESSEIIDDIYVNKDDIKNFVENCRVEMLLD